MSEIKQQTKDALFIRLENKDESVQMSVADSRMRQQMSDNWPDLPGMGSDESAVNGRRQMDRYVH